MGNPELEKKSLILSRGKNVAFAQSPLTVKQLAVEAETATAKRVYIHNHIQSRNACTAEENEIRKTHKENEMQ